MPLRNLPSTFSPDAVAEIDRRLSHICEQQAVRIPLAIESGSRAWGFASPDSDYDCRFIYVRSVAHHISPWAQRDVIETPLENDLDVNGWDLAKALKLLVKGNAVVIEWLMSPIVYRGEAWFRDALLAFSYAHAPRPLIGRHYLHLGERQRRTFFAHADVPQKKIFYALRPAASLRWLRMHPEASVPPMHLPTLMRACDPPQAVAALVEELIARKAVTNELGSAPLPAPIATFVDEEFAIARETFEVAPALPARTARDAAVQLYREIVTRLDGV